ncbi:MAG: hypothetical protein WDN04_21905 [Rhodospirillales bacterium]
MSGLELLAVHSGDHFAVLRVDEVRERKADAELGCERAAEIAGTQDPHFRAGLHHGLQHHAFRIVSLRQLASEQRDQVRDLLRERVAVETPGADRARGRHIAARRAADPEVDTSREQRLQHAELLRHLERAVVGQHHAARTHAQAPGGGGEPRDHHFRRRVGNPQQSVMLGAPVARVAELVRGLREVYRCGDRVGDLVAFDHRRLVEYREFDGSWHREEGRLLDRRAFAPRHRTAGVTEIP